MAGSAPPSPAPARDDPPADPIPPPPSEGVGVGGSPTPPLSVHLRHIPKADPGFVPPALWNRAYRDLASLTPGSSPLTVGISRPDGASSAYRTVCLPPGVDDALDSLNAANVERAVKFLLWSRGGDTVRLSGEHAEAMRSILSSRYRAGGEREFDVDFVRRLFDGGITFAVCDGEADLPPESASAPPLGRNLDGCRVGFDLGGSDRKCAALIDGEVVYTEEVPWDPYFEDDPRYHRDGIVDSIRSAAAHLPRVDAIGGSAAGVYVDGRVRVSSLFRGVTDEAAFDAEVRDIFLDVAEEWGAPFEVLNDGDVTALAASMSLGRNAIIGLAMGTSVAGGYCDRGGRLTNWLNELAFVPVDYRAADGPLDEWSGDRGCGVQYFSQQGACRLMENVGIRLPAGMKPPERLMELQRLMAEGDPAALMVYESLGIELGYTLAHWAEFYDYSAVLIMGRVTSGPGGEVMVERARSVLADEFPKLGIHVVQPSEVDKRHGQAIAAASLPATARPS